MGDDLMFQESGIHWRPNKGTEKYKGGIEIVPLYQGNGRDAVVLFSGFGGTRKLWKRTVTDFLKDCPENDAERPDVYYCNYPRHKAPWRWDPSITQVTGAVRDAMATSTHLRDKNLFFWGHSEGGLVAQGAVHGDPRLQERTRRIENVAVPFSGLTFLRKVTLSDIFARNRGAWQRFCDIGQYINPLKLKTQLKQMAKGSDFLERYQRQALSKQNIPAQALSPQILHQYTPTRNDRHSDRFVSQSSANGNPVNGENGLTINRVSISGRRRLLDGDHRWLVESGKLAPLFGEHYSASTRVPSVPQR